MLKTNHFLERPDVEADFTIDLGKHVKEIKRIKPFDDQLYVECCTNKGKTEIAVVEGGEVVGRYTIDGILSDYIPHNEGVLASVMYSKIVLAGSQEVKEIADLGKGISIDKIVFDENDIFANVFSKRFFGNDYRGRGGIVKVSISGSEKPLSTEGGSGSVVDVLSHRGIVYVLMVPDYPTDSELSFIGEVDEKRIKAKEVSEEAFRLAHDGVHLYYAAKGEDRYHAVLKRIKDTTVYPASPQIHIGRMIMDLWTDGNYTTVRCRGNGAEKFTRVLEGNHTLDLRSAIPRGDLIACDGKRLVTPVYDGKESYAGSNKLAVFEIKKA